MKEGTQEEVSLDNVIETIMQKVDGETLGFYNPSKDWIIEEVSEDTDSDSVA